MRLSLRILSLLLALVVVGPARADTLAEKNLREIVTRQKQIMARADADKEHLDEAWLRGELQSVISSYDILIQKNPDFAAGFAAYGLLLAQVGMSREAAGMLMKANQLDGEIALVKNEIARLLAEDGKIPEALPWLTAAVDLDPQEPLYHYHLGKLLVEGRDDLIATGQFTRAALDKVMLAAFQRAAALAPDKFAYAYRAAEAYYDLAEPKWNDALAAWSALETRAQPGIEQQTIRLHAANVLIKQGKTDHAKLLIDTVTEPALQKQKQTLLDELASPAAK
jgi:tetratricopeptide (TPR) repeat protein